MKQKTIAIPHFYVWMVEGISSPGQLFKRYVQSYVRNTRPGWELVKIEKMNAIIERK